MRNEVGKRNWRTDISDAVSPLYEDMPTESGADTAGTIKVAFGRPEAAVVR